MQPPSSQPSAHLHDIFYRISRVFIVGIGCDYLRPAYRRHQPQPLCVAAAMLFSAAGFVYTLATQEQRTRLQCASLAPLCLQGLAKYALLTAQAAQMRACVEHLMRIHRQCDRSADAAERETLVRWSLRLKRLITVCVAFVFVLIGSFCTWPLWVRATTGVWELLLPVLLPWSWPPAAARDATLLVYAVQTAYNLVHVYLSAVGLLAADLTFFLHVLHVLPLTAVLEGKVRALGEAVRARPRLARTRECTAALNNCIRMHADYGEYLGRVADIYYGVVIVEVVLDALSMCLVMFVLRQMVWFPLYLFWVCFMLKTLVACALGTVVDYCVRI